VFQVSHLAVAGLDLCEFALDGSSDRVRKLLIQHDFLVNCLHVVLCRLDFGDNRRVIAGHFLFQPVEPSFGSAKRGPGFLGIAAIGLDAGLKTSGNLLRCAARWINSFENLDAFAPSAAS
jgi:hypothetical protein